MTKEQIGSILKELRIDSGKTQKEVAEILGRTQQIVGHWETGYSQPDANTLFTLCDIYGTTVDAAFGFKKKEIIFTKEVLSLIEKYNALDEHGKEMVDFTLLKEWERSTASGSESKVASIDTAADPLESNAAHARKDIEIPEGVDTSEDNIMDDPNF